MDYWKYLQESVDSIAAHLREPLTLSSIARKAHCSVYHFSRLFREHTGFSVLEYTRRRRLVHAIHDLHGTKTVTQIAVDYQYTTGSGFYRAFYRVYGM